MVSRGPGLRWGVEQRLEFIEFCLFWEGGVNRSDITGFFGVSVPQASKDLSQYQELAPENVRYDRSEKRYFASDSFKPKFLKPDADQYLAELTSLVDSSFPGGHGWLTNPPSVDAMPVPHRRVDVSVLRVILAAIRAPASIEILYQSMNNDRPEPIWRRITPHAFGSDGFRWHVRAFCHIDGKFKDFILSRVLDVRDEAAPGELGERDNQWNNLFEVILAPNPKLGENQQKVIAQDYEMQDGNIHIKVRCALLYYFRKRLRLDVADALDDPREVPVVATNLPEFEAAIDEATR
ncbi:MAG: WYL domain-containing protein [Alphaproteobacteria bacterium]|nr:WYL domain-containing protein [Alphaproteobacteria bacterium]